MIIRQEEGLPASRIRSRARRIAFALVLSFATWCAPTLAQDPQCLDPSVCGQWDGPYDLFSPQEQQNEIVHAALISTGPKAGQVVFWRTHWGGGCPQIDSPTYLWDPAAPGSYEAAGETTGYNIFCGGMSFLPSGDLLVGGGTNGACGNECTPIPFPNYSHRLNVLGPFPGPPSPWSLIPLVDSCEGRYYPTMTTRDDGKIVLSGGGTGGNRRPTGCPDNGCTEVFSDSLEIFDPISGSWTVNRSPVLGQVSSELTLFWYPLMHVASTLSPNTDLVRRIFVVQAGTHGLCANQGGPELANAHCYAIDFDLNDNITVSQGPPPQSGNIRHYPTTAQLPKNLFPSLPEDEFIILGGGDPTACTAYATYERVELKPNVANSVWSAEKAMAPSGGTAIARIHQDACWTPDGKLFVVGGTSVDYQNRQGQACDGTPCPDLPVLQPLLYDPLADVWPFTARHESPRRYHSVAILLKDARVLVMGGQRRQDPTYSDLEIFSPPYLFQGFRPQFVGTKPTSVIYDSVFTATIQTKIDNEVEAMVLVRPGSVTHAFNMEQRVVGLDFTVDSYTDVGLPGSPPTGRQWTLSITGPQNGHVAPPGYYMLFALEGDGIPGDGVPTVGQFVQLQ